MPPVARSAWQRPGQPATPSACPWQRGIERPPGCCRFAQCPGPRLPFPPAAERTAVPSRRPPPRRRERAPPRGSRAIGQAASGPQTRSLRNLKDGRKEKKKLEANPLDKGACLRDCLQPLQLGPAASRDREARQRTRLLTLHVVQSQQIWVERYPGVAVFEGSPGQVICCARRGSRGAGGRGWQLRFAALGNAARRRVQPLRQSCPHRGALVRGCTMQAQLGRAP